LYKDLVRKKGRAEERRSNKMRGFIKHLLSLWIIASLSFLISCGEDKKEGLIKATTEVDIDGIAGSVFLPPPERGIQLIIGPFIVIQGKEIQRNYYMKLPSEVDIDVTKIEFAYNEGSHHVNIFKSDTEDMPDHHFEETFDAIVWEDWDMVAASQKESLSWQMPPGVGIHLKARQQLAVQVHYVNAATQTTPTGVGIVYINFHIAAPGEVKEYVGAYFANNRLVEIPPRKGAVFTKLIRPFSHDIKIIAMTGHFHSRGKNFIVNIWDEDKKAPGKEIYRNREWDEPEFAIFDLPLFLKKGKRLIYTTEFFNDTDKEVKFGPHVETEEHANLFMFYYPGPKDGKAVYDFDVRW
jgi:hypothetical protein